MMPRRPKKSPPKPKYVKGGTNGKMMNSHGKVKKVTPKPKTKKK